MSQFEKGVSGNPAGKPKGARNKISTAFLDALLKQFEAAGADALKIMCNEEPGAFIKVVASLLPKEEIVQSDVTVKTIITGVVRAGEVAPEGTVPAMPGPQPVAALPKPEPKAEPQQMRYADMVAPLPRASDVTAIVADADRRAEPAKVEKREKLIYWDKMPKPRTPTGWR